MRGEHRYHASIACFRIAPLLYPVYEVLGIIHTVQLNPLPIQKSVKSIGMGSCLGIDLLSLASFLCRLNVDGGTQDIPTPYILLSKLRY